MTVREHGPGRVQRRLFERAGGMAKAVPQRTELDDLDAFIESGAVITCVTAHSITLERALRKLIFEPRGFESFQGPDDGTESHRNITRN